MSKEPVRFFIEVDEDGNANLVLNQKIDHAVIIGVLAKIINTLATGVDHGPKVEIISQIPPGL